MAITIDFGNIDKEYAEMMGVFQTMGENADKVTKTFLSKGGRVLRDEVIKNINTILTKTTPKQRAASIAKWGKAVDKIKAGAVRQEKNGQGFYTVAGILRGDNSTQFYLKFSEYGTNDDGVGTRKIKNNGKTTGSETYKKRTGGHRQEATPVFRPAFENKKYELENMYINDIEQSVNKDWSGK